MEWKDVTSWSRSDVDRSTPASWELKLGKLRLVVTRNINYEKDAWIMKCGLLPERQLNSKDIDEAKSEALDAVADCIYEIQAALRNR